MPCLLASALRTSPAPVLTTPVSSARTCTCTHTAPQAYVGVNWVLTEEPLDVETELALGFLDYLMLVGGLWVGGLV